MSNNDTSIPQQAHPDNAFPAYVPSWEVNRHEIPDWLQAQADRLDKRAIRARNVDDVLHCLKLAQAARNAAKWYQAQGGAK